ncbi:MAG TPA: glycosyltransferase family 87 protein [Ramlibacter sp.]
MINPSSAPTLTRRTDRGTLRWHFARLSRALHLFAWLAILAYVGFVAWELGRGYAAAARGEKPLFTDYTSLYAASMLLQTDRPENLYIPRRMYQANVASAYAVYGDAITEAQARQTGFAPWMYPPTFILFAMPLAWLPYLPSFIAWILATAVPYLAAMRAIIPRRSSAAAFGLAAPPAFFNLAYGQTGFLSGGFIGLGLARLQSRPLAAGFWIGLASIKPHLGILIPVALAAGGHWRAFASAALTVVALIAASIAVLGIDPWYGFIGTTLFHIDGFDAGAYTWSSMASILSTAHLAGIPLARAWTLQFAAAALAALCVGLVWAIGRRRPDTLGLQSAILCLATPLAIPMVYLYDLVIVVPAAAWIWMDMRRHGTNASEVAVFVSSFAGLITSFLIAAHFDIQIGPALVAALLSLALRRFISALQTPPCTASSGG